MKYDSNSLKEQTLRDKVSQGAQGEQHFPLAKSICEQLLLPLKVFSAFALQKGNGAQDGDVMVKPPHCSLPTLLFQIPCSHHRHLRVTNAGPHQHHDQGRLSSTAHAKLLPISRESWDSWEYYQYSRETLLLTECGQAGDTLQRRFARRHV